MSKLRVAVSSGNPSSRIESIADVHGFTTRLLTRRAEPEVPQLHQGRAPRSWQARYSRTNVMGRGVEFRSGPALVGTHIA